MQLVSIAGRICAAALGIGAIAVLIGWLTGSIPLHAQVCPTVGGGGPSDCLDHYLPVALLLWVVDWLNRNEGAVLGAGTIALAVFTASLWWSTRRLWQASMAQSADMKSSLATAARSAAASESLAATAAANVQMARERSSLQMRAYVAVVVGRATYQERDKQWRFEGKPQMINNGHTPARKLSYVISASIEQYPLPPNFAFPLPSTSESGGSLNPQQGMSMSKRVPDYIPDQEVEGVKRAAARALHVWGVVRYEDVFGDSHKTEFAQVYAWNPDGTVTGYYLPVHNEAT